MKKTKEKTKTRSISKLFYNDKFVMIFSALVAVVLWIIVTTTSQESTVVTITDIQISLPELSDDLEFFNTEDLTAEVRISGNALILSTVTSSDIYVTASDVSEITEPGEYTVSLVPKKSTIKTDFSFDSSCTPSSIDVYVDRYAEKEFTVADQVVISSIAENCYAPSTVLSEQTITITGAETVINQIASVAAVYSFSETLSESVTQTVPLVLYDEDGDVIQSDYITMSVTSVEATVTVLQTKYVPIEVTYTNVPDGLSIDDSWVTVSQSEIYIAASADVIDSITSITTSELDLSAVNLSNSTWELSLDLPSGCTNLDNIDSVTVDFDMSDMAQKTFTVETFSVINQTSELQATVTSKSLTVTLVGPQDEIYSLEADDITAVVDMSLQSTVGLTETTVTIQLPDDAASCWTYGTYTVAVNVTALSEDE